MVGRVIDSLLDAYKEGMPEMAPKSKPEAHVEGQIGICLSNLMTEKFRRFNDSLMVFTGKRYELLPPDDVTKVVYGFMLRMGCPPAYMAKSVSVVCKMVMSNPFLENFEPSRSVIYMSNCVLVITPEGTVAKEDFDPKWMTDIYLDFPYIEDARCPAWEGFLSTVLDDTDARQVLQEFLGCMFVDKSTLSIEKALFLYGSGSNGKSVVYETLEGMLGDNITNAGLDQLNGHNGEYYAADWVGKLLAYNSDAEARDISSGKYKQLISKERITVRRIRQSPFESSDWPMFMANINKSIITTDSSDGFWRRNIVIGFNKVFSDNPDRALGQLKADRSFKSRMRGEYPGIFNWILVGRKRIIQNKGIFTKSKSIEQITKDMRTYSTGVYAFLESKGYYGSQPDSVDFEVVHILAKDMYDEYKNWCLDNGWDAKNASRFKDDMVNAKITWKRCMKVGGQTSSGYIFYKADLSSMLEEDAGEEYTAEDTVNDVKQEQLKLNIEIPEVHLEPDEDLP